MSDHPNERWQATYDSSKKIISLLNYDFARIRVDPETHTKYQKKGQKDKRKKRVNDTKLVTCFDWCCPHAERSAITMYCTVHRGTLLGQGPTGRVGLG